MIKQKVRIEIREDGWLNKMCEGSVTQALAFLQALDKEQTEQVICWSSVGCKMCEGSVAQTIAFLQVLEKEQTAQPDGQGKDTNPL